MAESKEGLIAIEMKSYQNKYPNTSTVNLRFLFYKTNTFILFKAIVGLMTNNLIEANWVRTQ